MTGLQARADDADREAVAGADRVDHVLDLHAAGTLPLSWQFGSTRLACRA